MIYIVLLIVLLVCGFVSAFAFRTHDDNKRLKRKLESYKDSLKYKDELIDELLSIVIARSEKKKTELRVKMVDGKMVGYMDKE